MPIKHRLLLIAALLLLGCNLCSGRLMAENKGDIVLTGNVFDNLMHLPITTAKVSLIDPADSSVVASGTSDGWIQYGDNREYTGSFYLSNLPRKRFKLRVANAGYEPQTFDLDLTKLGKRQFQLTLDPIYLM